MSLRRYSKLLPGTYHFLSAACFSIFNQPQIIPSLFDAARKSVSEDHPAESPAVVQAELHLARQFREALLRAGIFGGMSKAINVQPCSGTTFT